MAKTNDATLLPAAAWPSKTFPRPPMQQVLNQLAGFCKQIGYAKTLKALAKEAESKGITIDDSAIASQDGPLKLSLGDIYLDAFMNWPEEAEAEVMEVDKQVADSSSDDSSSDDSSSDSESSSDDPSSESESESSDEESETTAVPAKPAATVASKRKRDESDSDSDSSSDDDSDSEESEAPAAKKSKIKEANSDSDSDSSEDEEAAPASKKPKINEANSDDDSSEDDSSSSDESSDSSDDEAESKASSSEDSSDDSSDSSSGDDDDEPTPKQSKSKSTVDTASDSSKSSVTLAGSGTDDNGGMHPSRASRMAPAPLKSVQPAVDGKQKVEPFSRIPKNQYVDPRFGSNAYVSYDYADRAHQDLIVTKGKGFTKEKNKKKRGSYRGGMIDTAPKGIKFED